ncbi:hypothetical protein PFISCL1PPCAC_9832, partial [Pristionchus fissidentatus]
NRLTAFKDPLLHSFNKNASVIDKSSPILSDISSRLNLLVLGDSMGDLTMGKGLGKERENTLRIGFLNGQMDKLSQFLEGFDIVIINDQTVHIPFAIATSIISSSIMN